MEMKLKSGRITETQLLIINAFFEILADKQYENITVSEICEKAQVARKTFYNNFDGKDDIVGRGIDYFFNNWDGLSEIKNTDITSVYRSAFEFINENRQLFTLLYTRGIFRLAEGKLVNYCTEKWPNNAENFVVGQKYRNYYIPSMIAAFVSIVKTWVESGYVESVETLVELTDVLIISAER